MFWTRDSKRHWRKNGKNLLHMAKKVLAYRGDVLPKFDKEKLVTERDTLRALIADRSSDVAALKEACNRTHIALRLCGGKIYPVKFFPENIEMLLVAAILAIGVRSFFIQPFKIPTNSMYPTYYGMTPEVYKKPADAPNPLERVLRFATLGAEHYEAAAPVSGEIEVPLFVPGMPGSTMGRVAFKQVMGPKWFGLMRTPVREYTLYVGGKPVQLTVPFEFSLDSVIAKQFYPELDSMGGVIKQAADAGNIIVGGPERLRIKTGKYVKQGEPVLNFDILTGDMLFVDRFTYNFKAPQVGDPFVFRTKHIRGLDGPHGQPTDQYYIKRLVGTPGDVLKIVPPELFINGKPAEGASAFQYNAEHFGKYTGYVNRGALGPGDTVQVAPDAFYALGDNSPGSWDSRNWGMVPERDVVGKALFIFYPFTSRWGRAQ